MKISYNLGTEDILAFYKLGLKKKSFVFKNHIFIFGVAIALALSLFDKYFRNTDNLQSTNFTNNFWFLSAYNLVLVTLCIFLVRMIVVAFFRLQMRKKTKFMGDRDLEIVKGKLIFSSQNSKTEYPIKAILKIEENKRHFFVYMNEISAIIIPKKTSDCKVFIDQLTESTSLKVDTIA